MWYGYNVAPCGLIMNYIKKSIKPLWNQILEDDWADSLAEEKFMCYQVCGFASVVTNYLAIVVHQIAGLLLYYFLLDINIFSAVIKD